MQKNSNRYALRVLSKVFSFQVDPSKLPGSRATDGNNKKSNLSRANFMAAVAIMRLNYKTRLTFHYDEKGKKMRSREVEAWVEKVLAQQKDKSLATLAIFAEAELSRNPKDEKALKYLRNLKTKNKIPDVHAWRTLAIAERVAGNEKEADLLLKACKARVGDALSEGCEPPKAFKKRTKSEKKEQRKRLLEREKRSKELMKKYAD